MISRRRVFSRREREREREKERECWRRRQELHNRGGKTEERARAIAQTFADSVDVFDTRITALEHSRTKKIDAVDRKLAAVETKLDAKMGALDDKLESILRLLRNLPTA